MTRPGQTSYEPLRCTWMVASLEIRAMLRDQMMGFLQTAIVFLLLTNAVSALVAFYAMKTANALTRPGQQAKSAIERKLEALVGRA